MNDFWLVADVPGPYIVAMEDRVTRMEDDMRDVKSVLSRLEPMIIRIDATLTSTLPHLATKADLAEQRIETRTEISTLSTDLRAEMADLSTGLRSEMGVVSAGIRAEMAAASVALRTEMSDLSTGLRAEMAAASAAIRAEMSDLSTGLRAEMAGLRVDVHGKLGTLHEKLGNFPTKTYLWGVLGVLIAAYASGLAALAVLK